MITQEAINTRFDAFVNSLPSRGNAGEGWPKYLYEKKNNKYKRYPTHRYHVGVGSSAKIYNDAAGQIIIAPFVLSDKPEVYDLIPGSSPSGGASYAPTAPLGTAATTLSRGKTYYYWKWSNENLNDYWKLIKDSEKNQKLIDAGYELIDAGYGGVPPSINNQFGRPTDMELSINPNVLNQIENETLQQSKALFSITTLKLLIGITAAAAFTGLMYFLFKPKQQ